jgi:protein phosphatase
VIPANRAHLHVAASTHPGMRGKNNEDQYAVSAYTLSETDFTPSLLAILSDGIGGHRAGEVASRISVETISRIVAESDGTNPTAILENAITQASLAIFQQANTQPEKRGMGATCVCAWVIGHKLYAASVGDSRLYLLRGSTINQLTKDHTWIQEALDYGALTPEQARGHPNAHVIRRYIGSQPPPEVDFRLRLNPADTDQQALSNQGFTLIPGDFVVLCSDGLTDLVDKEEIKDALRSHPREKALQVLTQMANQRGGHDNITIVVLEIPARGDNTQISQVHHRSWRRPMYLLGVFVFTLLLLLILILAASGLFIYFSKPAATPTPTAIQLPTLTALPVLITSTQMPPPATSTPRQATSAPATLTPWPTHTPIPSATPTQVPPTLTPTSVEFSG